MEGSPILHPMPAASRLLGLGPYRCDRRELRAAKGSAETASFRILEFGLDRTPPSATRFPQHHVGRCSKNLPSIKRAYRNAPSFCARASRFITLETCQRAPRRVGIFRMFKAVAIAAKVIAPATVERPLAISVDGYAQSLLPVLRLVREPPGLAEIDLVSQLRASRLSDGQRSLRSFGDEPSLFLRQRGVEMSMTDRHPAQFGDDERTRCAIRGPTVFRA